MARYISSLVAVISTYFLLYFLNYCGLILGCVGSAAAAAIPLVALDLITTEETSGIAETVLT